MSKKDHRPQQIIEKVEILDAVAEGKSIARIDEMVVFVTNAVPGDVVDIRITRKKKNYIEGIPVKFHHYSDIRTEPRCEHFGLCGGCKWQNMIYSEQLRYKQKQVLSDFQRIGKVEMPDVKPVIPSQDIYFYRNKLDYAFSNYRWIYENENTENFAPEEFNALGFHIPGRFDRVFDVKYCHLQPSPSNEIRLAIKDYAVRNRLTFFDLKRNNGFLRNIVIRTTTIGETMLIVAFYYEDKNEIDKLMGFISGGFPSITSLMYVINPKGNDTFFDLEVRLFAGHDYITEEMEGLKFRIGPKSFYQTNSMQALRLFYVAREFAGLSGAETVYDLYSGTGTIANFISSDATKVIGVENIPEAVEDARVNSRINGIQNTTFFKGNIEDVLTDQFFSENGFPDVIIADPPRVGLHPAVVKALLKSSAPKIVYVSCNSATQARDASMLNEKYRLTAIQPVDMFPHTHHVENVILLEMK
ncbi:MAG: 23S rRNA (uracil(1939)-C(5))-methyltransferase RlmD [Bacteroidia bacterium]|nr:23S rRNA (uracil(1939)-C(5))-methyltransferase RlmD [Bacteroidia bacterium]